jgi:endoglucanase
MLASGAALDSAVITPDAGDLAKRFPKADAIYGGFAFRAPWWQEGELIYTKAADDLVGAFAVMSVALDRFAAKPHKGKAKGKAGAPSPFIGLLTRAEEVGFIGAIGHLELGWFKKARRPILGVSLETSRTLPGAEIGAGPVVRLGDKFTVFDSGALRVFTTLAEEVLPKKHQRRIMDGGTCEASAFTTYGFPCVGISVPLGNYHNQSFQGGPDSRGPDGPAPEFVHLGDVEGLIALCHGLLKPRLAWKDPFGSRQKDFRKRLKDYRPLLKAGP